ncbi:MAG: carbon monoxide dehydrogenase subunit G [Aestuariivita sp.]|nr:carbon monoxide dehydrogenase subunit G [Aestuariivita sp.]MCY4347301.1 carbon monoxide dehydrogenase subunit G [Aestuariivita sp.]
MKMQDSREIRAAREVVFNAIVDPEVLKECIAGAESVNGNVDDGYEAVVTQKVGPVKATFKGQVTISDIVGSEALTITGSGKGGAAGFANGSAVVTLSDLGDAVTKLSYEIEVKIGGKLAQIGSRIIEAFAKKMADKFFTQLQDYLELEVEEETEKDDLTEDNTTANEGRAKWYKRMIGKA